MVPDFRRDMQSFLPGARAGCPARLSTEVRFMVEFAAPLTFPKDIQYGTGRESLCKGVMMSFVIESRQMGHRANTRTSCERRTIKDDAH